MAIAKAKDSDSDSPTVSILHTIETVTSEFELCRNRVWAVARTIPEADRRKLLAIPSSEATRQRGVQTEHDECTFDFCEHSRLDFTSVAQRHECPDRACVETISFEAGKLEEAANAERPTAWALDGNSTIAPHQPFMAISHVWSDGTGSGAWPPGQVNRCLYEFFKRIAQDFQCEGIWWDTICIPKQKAARSKAIVNIQRNYEDARITLVHDCFIRDWEWVNAEVACFAIIMSPWFSRGWTSLELAKSSKVKVLFKGPHGPIVKDLDQDILAKPDDNSGSPHQIASKVIANLREKRIGEVDRLLSVLNPRHTSWPRDVAIISGHLVGITIDTAASQQSLYQDILKTIGCLSHDHLFHNSVPMSKGFNWCPTNIFDIPQSSADPTLKIKGNGDVTGTWGVLDSFPEDGYNWKGAHPLMEAKLRSALGRPADHVLLFDPKDDTVTRAVLAKVVDEDTVQFVGPVYLLSPCTRAEKLRDIVIKADAETAGKDTQTGPESADLLLAAANCDETRVELLLKGGADPNSKDEYAWTALHYAAWRCHDKIAQMLLDGKADQSRQDELGQHALHLAAERGNAVIAKALLEGEDQAAKGEDWQTAQCDDGQTVLHRAAWGGSADVVQLLLERFAIVNDQDKLGKSALHVAAEKGQPRVVSLLLGKKADPNLRDGKEQTALHLAAINGNGNEQVVDLLFKHNADPNMQDFEGKTALHWAATKGHNAVMTLLLKPEAMLDIRDSEERTALFLAASEGKLEAVKMLVQKDADIKAVDKKKMTALHSAVEQGELEVVKWLAGHVADNAADSHGWTKLHVAAVRGDKDVVEVLLGESDVDVGAEDLCGWTALHWMAALGDTAIAELLLNKGSADVHAKTHYEATALLLAAKQGHKDVAKLLLGQDAEVGAQDKDGRTALHCAAMRGHKDVVEILLSESADVDAQDGDDKTALLLALEHGQRGVVALLLSLAGVGQTELLYAAKEGRRDLVELLLSGGADAHAKDNAGKTALHWAAERGHRGVVRVLLDKGASISVRDNTQWTALHLASRQGEEDVVELLLERGADPTATENFGRTPLHLAAVNGHTLIVGLLLENGAEIDAKDRNWGMTALHLASREGHIEVVAMLLAEGASTSLADTDYERTALGWARSQGHKDVVSFIRDMEDNPDKLAHLYDSSDSSDVYDDF